MGNSSRKTSGFSDWNCESSPHFLAFGSSFFSTMRHSPKLSGVYRIPVFIGVIDGSFLSPSVSLARDFYSEGKKSRRGFDYSDSVCCRSRSKRLLGRLDRLRLSMAAFLHFPGGYSYGDIYDGSSLVGKNNPIFKNYPLPNYNYKTQASIDNFDFHLQSGSPAIGKGTTTAFTPIMNVPVDPNFGSSGITPPGKDMGCYQTDGTGNQH